MQATHSLPVQRCSAPAVSARGSKTVGVLGPGRQGQEGTKHHHCPPHQPWWIGGVPLLGNCATLAQAHGELGIHGEGRETKTNSHKAAGWLFLSFVVVISFNLSPSCWKKHNIGKPVCSPAFTIPSRLINDFFTAISPSVSASNIAGATPYHHRLTIINLVSLNISIFCHSLSVPVQPRRDSLSSQSLDTDGMPNVAKPLSRFCLSTRASPPKKSTRTPFSILPAAHYPGTKTNRQLISPMTSPPSIRTSKVGKNMPADALGHMLGFGPNW
ncbi:hypothetical protein CCM_08742 [Cordyceps militaris CM01]|uniref:Uncharacterized protein n=1 Tax=Cordyceps militaris (strain CM01) TaxID=983644 RepID=G3JS50_CORMM|nr:uncharacterized protein CCM_08742 [Cordyceps militaris CM01]EGX88696.1 hypothetical protein CCM_08742 [Cordyceps militaris CM01]